MIDQETMGSTPIAIEKFQKNKSRHSDRPNQRQIKADETLHTLITAARRLFASKGYHATGTEEIVASAGLTRGALYHHFTGKPALFQAVFEEIQQELTSLTPKPEPSRSKGQHWAAFRHAVQSYLDTVLQPEVQQIVLIDGPAVLGWDTWRNLQLGYGLRGYAQALEAAIHEGTLAALVPEAMAHLIFGAVEEAALVIANADNRPEMRKHMGEALDQLLKSMAAV